MMASPRPILALVLRLLAILALSTMVVFVKLAGEEGIHILEVMFWRQFVTVPMLLGYLAWNRSFETLRTTRLLAHFRRSVLGSIAMILTFSAAMMLPLAEAQTLNFTAPIFVTLLSIVRLRDTIGPWRWFALAVGLAGVVVMTGAGHSHIPPLGMAVGLGAAFMIALLTILIKDLNRTDNPVGIVFYFAAISAAMLGVAMPFVGQAHDPYGWMLLMALGVIGSFGQLLVTISLRFGSPASVIVMDYSGLIWATLFGWLVWNILPTTETWLGAPLIIGAGLIIAWREHSLRRAAAEAEVHAMIRP
mgnify:CR=1 FL=1